MQSVADRKQIIKRKARDTLKGESHDGSKE